MIYEWLFFQGTRTGPLEHMQITPQLLCQMTVVSCYGVSVYANNYWMIIFSYLIANFIQCFLPSILNVDSSATCTP